MPYDFENSSIESKSDKTAETTPVSKRLEDLKRDISSTPSPDVGVNEDITWGPNRYGEKPLYNTPIVTKYVSTDPSMEYGPAYRPNIEHFKPHISVRRAPSIAANTATRPVEQTPEALVRSENNMISSDTIHHSESLNEAELERLKMSIEKIMRDSGYTPEKQALIVDHLSQKMHLIQNNSLINVYDISTSKYGIGTINGSEKTPPGTHIISQKIGGNAKRGAIFEGRRNTGSIAQIFSDTTNTPYDSMTSRILQLSGREEHNTNSEDRAIYIHGTPEEGLIGTPQSHGCIRMKNSDIIELYNIISTGAIVEIQNTVQAL